MASQQVLEELKARARLSRATRTLLSAAPLPPTLATDTLASWGYRLLRGGWWMTRAEQHCFVLMLDAIRDPGQLDAVVEELGGVCTVFDRFFTMYEVRGCAPGSSCTQRYERWLWCAPLTSF